MKRLSLLFLSIFFWAAITTVYGQTLPVGTPVIEEALRRTQIQGVGDSNASFTIRPIYRNPLSDNNNIGAPQLFWGAKPKRTGAINFQFLPVALTQQLNTAHSWGWNDGPMIPAKGIQTKFSAGVYTRLGPVSFQLAPEFVAAANTTFTTFPTTLSDSIWQARYVRFNFIDAPERIGTSSYIKLFPGQSSLRIHHKKLSFGISTESLWWGPGARNALLMTNNAPGFAHLTLNTTAPLLSPIGSFEGQMISGLLKPSNVLPPDTGRIFNGEKLYNPKRTDGDRYLNGIILTWQPKWTKGLFLGITRLFYQYRSDVSGFDGYLPVFGNFFKSRAGREGAGGRDQMLSFFARLVMPESKAEVYAEYGRNDHSGDATDFALEPEHARAYIIGVRKIFATSHRFETEAFIEFTHLQAPQTGLLREIPSWYAHNLVRHGYTHLGQVAGAGIGSGGSSQIIGVNLVRGIEKIGLHLERLVHDNDFYYQAFTASRNFSRHWVDINVGATANIVRGPMVYAINTSYIHSINYQWQESINSNNLHFSLSAAYRFPYRN